MSPKPSSTDPAGPVLLCFDGSQDAAMAIASAGRLLTPGLAVVLTVWEPVAVWQPYDPATILSAPLEKLAANALELDEIAKQVGQDTLARGVELAGEVGFRPQGRLASGKAWRAICRVAAELSAEVVVLGARGLGRVEGMLLGSVSSAVALHARCPVLIVPHQPGH